MGKIKILIIDDSAVVRSLLTKELSKHSDFEIVGAAPDPFIARDMIIQKQPDVLTLDIEMPRMDGITFLEKLMKSRPMPVVVLSTLTPKGCATALQAMELGAVEVMHKPELDLSYKLNEMMAQLAQAIRAAAAAKAKFTVGYKPPAKPMKSFVNSSAMIKTTDKVIAIGASTGGTEAIRAILPTLPANFPGIVITQHMPAHFTKSFADSLNKISAMDVKEAENDDTVRPGLVLIAPGNFHMLLKRSGARYYVEVKDGPMVYHQRPAVEVLFDSVAKFAGANAIGVILTGMGKDGGKGLRHMKDAGAFTIAQDEKSCVVYGMPKAAVEEEGASLISSLQDIPGELMKRVSL